MRTSKLVIRSAALAALTPVAAADLYVNPATGMDTAPNDGSAALPYKTIQRAVDELVTNSMATLPVRLEAGVYGFGSGESFPVSIPSSLPSFSMLGVTANGAFIDSEFSAAGETFVIEAGSVDLVDVRIAAGGNNAIAFGQSGSFSGDLALDSVDIESTAIGVRVQGSSCVIDVADSTIYGATDGIALLGPNTGHALSLTRTRIRDCYNGVLVQGQATGHSVATQNSQITDNVAGIRNTTSGFSVDIEATNIVDNGLVIAEPLGFDGGGIVTSSEFGGTSMTLTARNSIFWDNVAKRDIFQTFASFMTFDQCIVENILVGALSGTYILDPRIVDGIDGDFHLLASSPAINFGSLAGTSVIDLDGDPVTSSCGSSLPDIGADAFVPDYVYSRDELRIGGSADLGFIASVGDEIAVFVGKGGQTAVPVLCATPIIANPVFLGAEVFDAEGFTSINRTLPLDPALVGLSYWISGSVLNPMAGLVRLANNVDEHFISY